MDNITVVEDNLQTTDFLVRVAAEVFPESQVRTACNLHDAEEAIAQTRPDMILLDIGLPDGSGLTLFDLPEVKQSCVVVTTIFDDDKHLFDALSLGAQGYLLKDEPHAQLVSALQGIDQGHPPLSASVAQRILGSFRTGDATGLSPREQEVLTLLTKGHTNRQAAQVLELSVNTVASYIKNIYQKLCISNRAEATAHAIKMGLLR